MDKLFKMFGKLRRTAEINNEGIGLGLMICENLVKMNHGNITVHSEGEEKGSVFTFTMKMQLQKSGIQEKVKLKNHGKLLKSQQKSDEYMNIY